MKFTTDELLKLIQEGKSQREAAAILGVSEGAVSKRLKGVGVAVNKNVALFAAPQVLQRQLSTAEQLEAIGRQARDILEMLHLSLQDDSANDKAAREARWKLQRLAGQKRDLLSFIVSMQGELRKQLEFDFNMRKEIYNIRQVQEFQDVVLQEIKNAAPEVAQRIVARLTEIQATRSSLDFGLGEPGQTL